MKKRIFIKGGLTQKRALKQIEGALKCETQHRLRNDNRNSKIGWVNRLSQTCQKNEKYFLNPMLSSSYV